TKSISCYIEDIGN
ncbi:hypothetical protein TNIN_437251, partial [Trichonephila inaurata madagascariensis]